MKALKQRLTQSAQKQPFKQILFSTHDQVDEIVLRGIKYPAIWFMLPFSYKNVAVDTQKARRWDVEFMVVDSANRDLTDDELADAYELPSALLDDFFKTLTTDCLESNGKFYFDEEDTEEIQPKMQNTVDNSIGWYVITKITEITT
jgi:hypothetical protein